MPTNPSQTLIRSPSVISIKVAIAALLFSLIFFAWDIVEDFWEDRSGGFAYAPFDIFHRFAELAAVVALGYAVLVLYRHLQDLRQRTQNQHQTISVLRGHVHELIQTRFAEWGLTPAEQDVANLLLKGCSSAEISAARNTAPGTIKAQSTAIFRKAGVKSKPELMALFMDEFTGPSEVPIVQERTGLEP